MSQWCDGWARLLSVRTVGLGVGLLSTLRVALGVEYDGSSYCGWQRQPGYATVQADLEAAVSRVADASITLCCAGRTDGGVHATGQAVHFDTSAVRQERAWAMGANRYLSSAIKVRWAKVVSPSFHARFSALARYYRYVMDNSPWRPALLGQGLTYFPCPLNVEAMHHAGQFLLGEHDFTSFRALQCQSHSPWRHMMQVNVVRQGNYVIVDLQANAFVHHMVRYIVGALLQVGCGKRSPAWVATLLALRDRTQAAATAKAQGLYLVRVDYPAMFGLPVTPQGPLFLVD